MTTTATASLEAPEGPQRPVQTPEHGPCRECGSIMSNRMETPRNEWAAQGRWICVNQRLCRRRAAAKVKGESTTGIPLDAGQVIITTPYLPPDRFMLYGIDTSVGPIFTVSEIAKFFLHRSGYWIRWREKIGHVTLDGVEVATSRTPVGARKYTLTDVEQMAHALASHGAIDGAHLVNILLVVQAVARLYGYTV